MKQEILKIEKATEKDQEVLNKIKCSTTGKNNVILLDSCDTTENSKSLSRVSTETTVPTKIKFFPVSTTIEAEHYNLKYTIGKEDETAIKVEDIVRVKPSVKRPHYGWGCTSHSSVGVILSVEGSVVHIQFPELNY